MSLDETPMGNGPDEHDGVVFPADALHRLTVALTVAHGHAQLVQRRIRQSATPDHDALLHTMAQMAAATQAMVAELHALRRSWHRSRHRRRLGRVSQQAGHGGDQRGFFPGMRHTSIRCWPATCRLIGIRILTGTRSIIHLVLMERFLPPEGDRNVEERAPTPRIAAAGRLH
jgi:hypothetical protein